MTSVLDEAWPSIRQAAERYNSSTDTIRRRIQDGTLRVKRFGPKLIRIDPASLEEWGAATDSSAVDRIRAIVDSAPPLTQEQRDAIARLIGQGAA